MLPPGGGGPAFRDLRNMAPGANDAGAVHVHLPSTIAALSPAELRELPGRALAEARLQRVSAHVVERETGGGGIVEPGLAPDEAALPELSWDEVGGHNTRDDCWVAIGGIVYDLSGFLAAHPGGEALVLDAAAGGDATGIFQAIHDPKVLSVWGGTLVPKVGRVTGTSPPLLSGRAPWGGWQPTQEEAEAAPAGSLSAARAAELIAQNPHLDLRPLHSLDGAALRRLLAHQGLPTGGEHTALLSRLEQQQTGGSSRPDASSLSTPSLPRTLESPFPHGRFEDDQLEAVRFQWADYSRLTEPNSGAKRTNCRVCLKLLMEKRERGFTGPGTLKLNTKGVSHRGARVVLAEIQAARIGRGA